MSPSPTQILIVLAIVLVLFGAKRIPELARGLGSGVREFKGGVTGELPPQGESGDPESSAAATPVDGERP